MESIEHPSNNAVLGAPVGWDQSALPCDVLPVTRTVVDGVPCIMSFWKPSAAELASLQAGASVALWVVGETMPPVSLTVDA
jgi:hypothetical protein